MDWIPSYPPVKALHRAASWTVPMGTVSGWCTGWTRPIHTEIQTRSISSRLVLPVIDDGRDKGRWGRTFEVNIVQLIVLINVNHHHREIHWKNKIFSLWFIFSIWGSIVLLLRGTMPALWSCWIWTSQIQQRTSHETHHEKNLLCGDYHHHHDDYLHQNRPRRQKFVIIQK